METAAELIDRSTTARRENRPKDAWWDLANAVRISRESGNRVDLIRSLKAFGQIERDTHYVESARATYEEAVELCREENDPIALAHTIRHLGDIHQELDQFEAAEACYSEALRLYRGDVRTEKLDLANTVRSIALLRDATGMSNEAVGFWQEAKDLYETVKVPAGVNECSERLAQP